ncbi:N-acetylglucosamine kinase [Luteipulveratus mongoliensis]|uniref:ATPase n=1 Tax=Luteipulveratus mongoliensis TaxID=571913 RepID=A0A0K1JDF2_9MICO|nr:BadF/BadG/BcrA/BcrD ATPase family protein [Luteipulveratus mongoliensis]AKU14724.1 ATPase [Luteipulveratus mongoliensis]
MGVTRAILAIDAGNSKTDVALVSVDGTLLGTVRGGGFRPHLVGARAAVRTLVPLVEDVRRAAGEVEICHVAACLANADLPVEHEALDAAIRDEAWAPSTEVVNDTFALLHAGTETGVGVAVICGAGTNCSGVLADGTVARFFAVGTISGDWGGGGFLWQEAMWWAARAEDGRGPDTALRTALPSHLGLSTMAELIEAVHLDKIAEHDRMSLTPVLFKVADGGDQVAIDLVRRQGQEIVALAAAAIRRLDAVDEPLDVVLGGGVLTSRNPLLLKEIRLRLAEQAPHAVPRVVATPPVLGAARLGLRRVGAPDDAHARLRRAFAG